MARETPDDASLWDVTASAIGSTHEPIVGFAVAQGRAADRYHMHRVCSRKLLATARNSPDQLHREYGIYLGKGAVLTLKTADTLNDGQEAGEKPSVRLVHIFTFSRPGMTSAELGGQHELPGPVQIDWYDARRPAASIRQLVPRVLGPLPPDLAGALLPVLSGPGAGVAANAEVASYAFAAWVACLPLEHPAVSGAALAAKDSQPPTGASGGGCTTAATVAEPAIAVSGHVRSKWASGVRGLLHRALVGRRSGKGATKEALTATDAARSVVAPDVAASRTGAPPPAGPGTCALTLEAAWSEFERRVLERPVAEYATDLERAWLAELKVMPTP